jgi:hypothetical protein
MYAYMFDVQSTSRALVVAGCPRAKNLLIGQRGVSTAMHCNPSRYLLPAIAVIFILVAAQASAQFTTPNIRTDVDRSDEPSKRVDLSRDDAVDRQSGRDTSDGSSSDVGLDDSDNSSGSADNTDSSSPDVPGTSSDLPHAIDAVNTSIDKVKADANSQLAKLGNQLAGADKNTFERLTKEITSLKQQREVDLARLDNQRRYLRDLLARTDQEQGLWLPFTNALGAKVFYEDSAFTALLKGVTRSQLGIAANKDAPSTVSLYSELVSAYLGPARFTFGALLDSKANTVRDSSGVLLLDSTRIRLNALNEFLNGGGNALVKLEVPVFHIGSKGLMLRAALNGNVAGSLAQIGSIDPRNGAVTWRAGIDVYGLYADHDGNYSFYLALRGNMASGTDAVKTSLGVAAGDRISFLNGIVGVAIAQRVHLNLSFYMDPNHNLGTLPMMFTATVVPE